MLSRAGLDVVGTCDQGGDGDADVNCPWARAALAPVQVGTDSGELMANSGLVLV